MTAPPPYPRVAHLVPGRGSNDDINLDAGEVAALAGHDEPLRSALSAGYRALYAEWLFLAHSLEYDRLPSFLIVIDFWRGEDGFASAEERDALCAESGLVSPPELWRAVPNGIGAVERLFGRSAWGSGPAEGLVARRVDDVADAPCLGKLLAPGFDRLGDDDWRRGRPRNRLAEAATWGGVIETG